MGSLAVDMHGHCGASNVRVRAIYLLYDAESCIRMACASCGLSWRSQLRADVGWAGTAGRRHDGEHEALIKANAW